jgi:predicted O-methyltransferase YrrM
MADGPMVDRTGLIVAFLRLLPEPVKNIYRTIAPASLHQGIRRIHPYEQDLARAVSFWAKPGERRRKKAELQQCRTPEDYFAFATSTLAHQQWKPEILGFLNFAAAEKPVRIAELGLFLGGTNLMLTHALPTVRLVVGVDMHLRNKTQLRYFAGPSRKQVFVEGKTCDSTSLKKVTEALGGEKLDLLFIDADHSYAGVKQDFMHYRQFVRDGGIIAFHDIVQDHLTKFSHDPATWSGARSGEVYLFWKRLKSYYKKTQEFVVDYDQDGCGIGALIYSSKVAIPEDL